MIDSDFYIYRKIKDDRDFDALFRSAMPRRTAAPIYNGAAAI